MKGVITNINNQRGMVAVETENGDYSIFELLSNDKVVIGDQVEWTDHTSLGDTTLKNKTQGIAFNAYRCGNACNSTRGSHRPDVNSRMRGCHRKAKPNDSMAGRVINDIRHVIRCSWGLSPRT